MNPACLVEKEAMQRHQAGSGNLSLPLTRCPYAILHRLMHDITWNTARIYLGHCSMQHFGSLLDSTGRLALLRLFLRRRDTREYGVPDNLGKDSSKLVSHVTIHLVCQGLLRNF